MKTKLILPALLLATQVFLPGSLRADGVRLGFVVGFQGGWAPSRFCSPAASGCFLRFYAPWAYTPWGYFPGVQGATSSPGFRTVSTAFDPPSGPVIIRVPAPILPVQADIVTPTVPFRWKR